MVLRVVRYEVYAYSLAAVNWQNKVSDIELKLRKMPFNLFLVSSPKYVIKYYDY